MIILAAMLASGQVLPWVDRRWLDEQARLEAAAERSKRPVIIKAAASPNKPTLRRKLATYENTIGM